jgi:hypothetical protein
MISIDDNVYDIKFITRFIVRYIFIVDYFFFFRNRGRSTPLLVIY